MSPVSGIWRQNWSTVSKQNTSAHLFRPFQPPIIKINRPLTAVAVWWLTLGAVQSLPLGNPDETKGLLWELPGTLSSIRLHIFEEILYMYMSFKTVLSGAIPPKIYRKFPTTEQEWNARLLGTIPCAETAKNSITFCRISRKFRTSNPPLQSQRALRVSCSFQAFLTCCACQSMSLVNLLLRYPFPAEMKLCVKK